jgi:hypothetical protein
VLPDAGSPVVMTLIDAPIDVVRGTSVTMHVNLANPSHVPFGKTLTVAPAQLPEGVTATPASWNDGPDVVALTLTAAPDAPEGETTIEIRAFADGKIVTSADTILAVSDTVGALDTSYGDNGCVFLPTGSSHPSAMRFLADGTIVIAGFDNGVVFVDRFAPNGTIEQTTTPTAYIGSLPVTIGDDGRIAFVVNQASGADVFEMDATGHTAQVAHFLHVSALSWDGDALFVAANDRLAYVTSSSEIDTQALAAIGSLETIGSGVVLAGGITSTNAGVVASYVFDGTTLGAGSTYVSLGKSTAITNTVTGAFGSIVGVESTSELGAVQVVNDASASTLTTVSSGWKTARVAALPNAMPLLYGTFADVPMQSAIVIQAFSLPFGAAGRTFVRFGGDTSCGAGALDPTSSYLYVTGNVIATNGLLGFVARIRLTSTP